MMKLTSCNNCGLVYDLDKINFPEIYDKNDELIESQAEWNGDKFVPTVKCFCGEKILADW